MCVYVHVDLQYYKTGLLLKSYPKNHGLINIYLRFQ